MLFRSPEGGASLESGYPEGGVSPRGINSARSGLKPAVNVRTVHLTFLPYERHPEFKASSRAKLMLLILRYVATEHGIVLHEAAAMEEHVHLLASFAVGRHLENDIVKNLKGASARYYLASIKNKSGKLWGRKKHYEDITSENHFQQVLRDIRENPKKSGLSPKERILSSLTADFSPHAAGFIPRRDTKRDESPRRYPKKGKDPQQGNDERQKDQQGYTKRGEDPQPEEQEIGRAHV